LQYEIQRAALLDETLELPLAFSVTHPLAANNIRRMCTGRSFSGLGDFFAVIDAFGVMVNTLLLLTVAVALGVRGGVCNLCVRSLALGRRLPLTSIPQGFPPVRLLRRLRSDWQGHGTSNVTFGPETYDSYIRRYSEVLLYLPPVMLKTLTSPQHRNVVSED